MLPVLYSFRRCPYAMRARLAIAISGQKVQLREIVLKQKPVELLAISPNKTIPVLQLKENEDKVLHESLDIMMWALAQHDPQQWLTPQLSEMLLLIENNDHQFKPWLDKYKYADRFPEYSEQYYRGKAEVFLMLLEQQLNNQTYLFALHPTLADMAIFPFIRQFAAVDKNWFEQSPYSHVRHWLATLMDSALFGACMKKYPTWLSSGKDILFP